MNFGNKLRKKSAVLLIIIILIFMPASFTEGSDTELPVLLELSQEELANLAKPSVVRIMQHVQGKMTVYPFDIDFNNLTIFPATGEQPQVLDIDEYYTGSGMVINPDGYILTNSHVVSYQTVKLIKAVQFGAEVIIKKEALLSDKEKNELSRDEKKLADFGKKVSEYILGNSNFEITKTVAVLNPASQSEKKEDLMADGFQARMISVNDNFYRDNGDAAVIKIDEDRLPAVKLGNSDSLRTGETIFVFGFPGTADFNSRSMLESTFSKGIVGALKDSDNKNFKIIQTDAKVSRGSSGGPLLNNRGEVIGLITYQTGELEQTAGDNFAFAIPINNVMDMITSGYIDAAEGEPREGDYSLHFRLGLAYLRNNECKKAINELNYAISKVNDKFEKGKNVQDYLNQCQSIIEANQSTDTGWQKLVLQIKKTSLLIWILFSIGFLVFILLIVIFWHLSKKIKKDEKEINALEKQINTDEKEIGKLEKIVVQVKEENSKDIQAKNPPNIQKSEYAEKNKTVEKSFKALDEIEKFGVVKFDDKK